MSKPVKNTLTPRHLIMAHLVQKFVEEHEMVMKQYQPAQQLELTEHLLSVMSCLKQYASDKDDTTYAEFVAKEDQLLKQYGKLLKPYKQAHFERYFYTETLLAEKRIISTEEFNRLGGEQSLTLDEMLEFVRICSNVLYMGREFLLLEQEPTFTVKDDTVSELPFTVKQAGENGKEFTKARQLLTLHYLLSSGFGIEPRSNASVSSLTRFAHLMTGTPFTSLQNSEIYKKYRLMPNYKKGLELITDLQFIRPYFVDLGLTEAVSQIDAEIQREKKELGNKKKE